jgi:pSer/pThr/pTyr-binding forkhead associated (FHA) protein
MPSLVIIEGQNEGAHFPIADALVSVGRDEGCTIQILDQTVSRKHLQIRLEAALGKHVAADYRSAHGVFINDRQIASETILADGDRIRIGQTTLVYLAADQPADQSVKQAARHKGEWKRSTIIGPG